MIAVRVNIHGEERWRKALGKIKPRENPAPFRRALVRGALAIQAKATTVYILRGGTGPPDPVRLTSRSGTLRRSIGVDRSELGGLSISTGTDLVYGPPHEVGGRYLPPRPFLGPAADEVLPTLPEIFVEELARDVGPGQ